MKIEFRKKNTILVVCLNGFLILTLAGCASFALHQACFDSDIGKVRSLVSNKKSLNLKDLNGNTPLHYAAARGHEDVAELLIQKGAKIDVQSHCGRTPLMEAAAAGDSTIIKLLLDTGADVRPKDQEGASALILASQHGDAAMLRALLDAGAFIHDRDNNTGTALYYACLNGKEEAAELLLAKGSDIGVKTKDGYTALEAAVASGKDKIIELLIKAGAEPQSFSSDVILTAKTHMAMAAFHYKGSNYDQAYLFLESAAQMLSRNNQVNAEIQKSLEPRLKRANAASQSTLSRFVSASPAMGGMVLSQGSQNRAAAASLSRKIYETRNEIQEGVKLLNLCREQMDCHKVYDKTEDIAACLEEIWRAE